ncbi:MAG: ATP-binding protein [DPANN group archaeon]|nr:ATP-binding protein [DPANN group archaeon]
MSQKLEELVGRADGLYTSAMKHERSRDFSEARRCYLEAADLYVQASRIQQNRESRDHLKRGQQCLEIAKRYAPGVGKSVIPPPPQPVPAIPVAPSKPVPPPDPKKIAPEKPTIDEKKEDVPDFLLIERPNVKLDDVVGMPVVKQIINEVLVYPFTRPELYQAYGKQTSEAVLLYGPPGCGKTFVAKAAAGEGNATFLFVMPYNLLKSGEGETERNIVTAFEFARENSPSIMYFDEFDSLANKKRVKAVNTLLAQMDGLQERPEKSLILASTNKPWEIAPALRRSGRFSKHVLVSPPDLEMRTAIFEKECSSRPVETSVNYIALAGMTEWYSAADIAEVVKLAADIPFREALSSGGQARQVTLADFQQAISQKPSTLGPWFTLAEQQIERSGERDEFKDLLDMIERYKSDMARPPVKIEGKSSGGELPSE